MRRVILMMALAVVSNSAMAEFTCEKIKDITTRASCIKDRVEREEAAAAEKEKAIANEKNNELDDFVRKSKEELTRNYKDPAAAQFTNLVVVDYSEWRALCGTVNGKNSYGGYVGGRKFTVIWFRPDFFEPRASKLKSNPFIRTGGSEDSLDDKEVERSNLAVIASYCEHSTSAEVTVTKIEK